jgi:manganese/zinc/iron transport system permease protein
MGNSFWIILTGALVAGSCAILGSYLILRKMAMVGDAISHAVLPGIVIAFFITGSRSAVPMLLGAGAFGLLTTFLIEFFHRRGKLQSDAAIGVTFTFFFALGVILVSAFASQIDLDTDCVLYGELAYVPLDIWLLANGTNLGPRTVWIMLSILLLILTFVILFYKELFLSTFDPAFASAIGISTSFWHYALMGMVSLTTVAAFESVGAILVMAFLIVPPATAYLLTRDFKIMLFLSAGIGVLVAFLGYYLAVYLDASIAGSMASVAGTCFFCVFLIKKN